MGTRIAHAVVRTVRRGMMNHANMGNLAMRYRTRRDRLNQARSLAFDAWLRWQQAYAQAQIRMSSPSPIPHCSDTGTHLVTAQAMIGQRMRSGSFCIYCERTFTVVTSDLQEVIK